METTSPPPTTPLAASVKFPSSIRHPASPEAIAGIALIASIIDAARIARINNPSLFA
jgi:hypothetical protein